MKYSIRPLIFILFLTIFNGAFAQFNKIELNSTILSEKDSSTIGFVHIINLTTKHGVISDFNGKFSFTISSTDTIKISVLGYESVKIIGSYVPKTIYLSPKNYELDEFTVIPYKNYNEFKEAFINLVLADSSLRINSSIFMFDDDLFLYRNNDRFGIVIEGGISKLYEYFSKHGKSKIRYEELLARDRYKSYLATKYNNLVVTKTTGLTDQAEVEKFMKYCKLSDSFIAHSNDYEIIKKVQDCFKEYKTINKKAED